MNEASTILPFTPRSSPVIWFDRTELNAIMNLYGRMVSAGLWRDYAICPSSGAIVFAAFKRASERPDYQIVKEPCLRGKQGQFRLIGPSLQVLKRGDDLALLLKSLNSKALKLIDKT